MKQWADNGWLRAHHSSRQEIACLPLILGGARQDDADYLETCRIKRNTVEYDVAGAATDRDAAELLEFARQLRQDVMDWIKRNHPQLAP